MPQPVKPLDERPSFPQRLSRQIVYRCPWLTLYKDQVLLTDGSILPAYHVLEFLPGVGVLVENSQGELLFEQVYRYPTGRLEWEIPAGSLEAGEDPLETARREVFEETGYETHGHRLVYTYFPKNAVTDQRFHLVHCCAGQRTGDMDAREIKSFRWFNPPEVQALLHAGELMDGLSLTGFLLFMQGIAK